MLDIFGTKLTINNYKLYGSLRLIIALFFIVCCGALLYQLYLGEESKKPRTNATVIGNEKHTLGKGTDSEQVIYTPILEYAVEGKNYTTSSGVTARSSQYNIGEEVEITYDPEDPSDIFQSGRSRFELALLTVSILGLTGLGIAVNTIKETKAIRQTEQQKNHKIGTL